MYFYNGDSDLHYSTTTIHLLLDARHLKYLRIIIISLSVNQAFYDLLYFKCCLLSYLLRLYTFPPTMVLLIYMCLLTCRLLEHNSCIFSMYSQFSTNICTYVTNSSYWYKLFEDEKSPVLFLSTIFNYCLALSYVNFTTILTTVKCIN